MSCVTAHRLQVHLVADRAANVLQVVVVEGRVQVAEAGAEGARHRLRRVGALVAARARRHHGHRDAAPVEHSADQRDGRHRRWRRGAGRPRCDKKQHFFCKSGGRAGLRNRLAARLSAARERGTARWLRRWLLLRWLERT